MSKKLCSKCNTPISRFAFWHLITGRYSYLCPNCGVVCSYCVERYVQPVVVCKFCGAVVTVNKSK
ncbi:MAG: hypothetical protein IJ436_08315 [Bacteroidaceae bacterium]|nr:hypothetical protein [Bacteroidaceae bacterium]